MQNYFTTAAAISCILGTPLMAKSPEVVTDIAPIYSIVAQVMDGVGEPSLLVEPTASPHDYSLRPSQARALQDADVVFAVSEELTPWLMDSLSTLAKNADVVILADTAETVLLDAREDSDEHTADDHDDEHEKERGGEHGDDEAGHDAHIHDGTDPHSWLDPENAAIWAVEIARVLTEKDPENADVYSENASGFSSEIGALVQEIAQVLKGSEEKGYIVYHDAFQYFEKRFNVPSLGAISNSEASDPGPRRIRNIKELLAETGATCLVSEPGYQKGIVQAISPSGDLIVAELDPLGSLHALDKALYADSLTVMAKSLAKCLNP